MFKSARQFQLNGHEGPLRVVACHPQGHWVATGADDGQICLWSLKDQRMIHQWRDHQGPVLSLAWDAEGQVCASGSVDESLCFWHAHHDAALHHFDEHRDNVSVLAWSPSGESFASAGQDCQVVIWDVSKAQVGHRLWFPSVAVGLFFDADGQGLTVVCQSGQLFHWHAQAVDQAIELVDCGSSLKKVCQGDEGELLIIDAQQQLFLWSTKQENPQLDVFKGLAPGSCDCAWNQDCKTLAVAAQSGKIHFYRLVNGSLCEEGSWQAHVPGLTCVDFDAEGRLISGGADGLVRSWMVTQAQAKPRVAKENKATLSFSKAPSPVVRHRKIEHKASPTIDRPAAAKKPQAKRLPRPRASNTPLSLTGQPIEAVSSGSLPRPHPFWQRYRLAAVFALLALSSLLVLQAMPSGPASLKDYAPTKGKTLSKVAPADQDPVNPPLTVDPMIMTVPEVPAEKPLLGSTSERSRVLEILKKVAPQTYHNVQHDHKELMAVLNMVNVDFASFDIKTLHDVSPYVHTALFEAAQLRDEDLEFFAGNTNLIHLDISGTQVTDIGLKHLEQCPNLKFINIYNTEISDAGLSSLRALPKLKHVITGRNQITRSGMHGFLSANPRCEVRGHY